jgi:hypothetical protein
VIENQALEIEALKYHIKCEAMTKEIELESLREEIRKLRK